MQPIARCFGDPFKPRVLVDSGKDLQPNIPQAIDMEQCFRTPVLEVDVEQRCREGKVNEDQ